MAKQDLTPSSTGPSGTPSSTRGAGSNHPNLGAPVDGGEGRCNLVVTIAGFTGPCGFIRDHIPPCRMMLDE